jgi:hypothetical protein
MQMVPRFAALLSLLPFLFAAASPAQSALASPSDATALVRRAVQHRLEEDKNHHPVQYLIRKIDEHHDTTKLIVETKDGDVARLVAINGKPLSPETDKAELARLDDLAQHPELQEHRRKSEQKDTDRVNRILGLLPDALLYKFQGAVPCGADQCYRISFKPNPNFAPPDLEANILRGVAGEVWVDQSQERLTRLDAHFISDVDFGFGIVGRLNKGGTVLLEQSDIGGRDWELTGMKLHVTGKIFLVKSLSSQVDEQMGHFAPVAPGMSYRDAIQLLKKATPTETTYTP